MRAALAATLCILASCASAGLSPPPATSARVEDTYHGVVVADSYRWLEEDGAPAVKAWSAAQTAFAKQYLDALPGRDVLKARIQEILGAKLVSHGSFKKAGDRLFAMKLQPPKAQSFLVVMTGPRAPESAKVLLDPSVLDPSGTTAIDFYRPSPDGKLVAVSLSKGGSESGDVVVIDVETTKPTGDLVPRVNGGTAGGDLTWSPDSKSFFYSRYPRGTERPAEDMSFFVQIYRHTIGRPSDEDTYELGKDFPRIAEIQLDMDLASGRLLATVQNGDGGEFAHYLRSSDGTWKQLTRFDQKIVQASFGPKDTLYLVSRHGAPRGKLLRAPIEELAKATVIIPEGEDTITNNFWGTSVWATATRLLVEYQRGGPSEIRVFDHDGKPLGALGKKDDIADVGGLTWLGGDTILIRRASYVAPSAWFELDAASAVETPLALATQPPVDLSGFEVKRAFATSKDGTKVPFNIVHKKGLVLDGKSPCLATGYGGYGVNITPSFPLLDSVLLERGVVFVEANLRGGGELGEAWHLGGNLTRKQNVFDDFQAVLSTLIEEKYTSAERLVIVGGSNGGLLMGATFTQRPDLVKAVVSYVGIYDMLRVELSSNGEFNVPEFGTVKDRAQFDAMFAYSPYHHVEDGTRYPAILFFTGENDPRVEPMQSRKMTARLQAAVEGRSPVLLVTSGSSGHGIGSSLETIVSQSVDAYAFILAQLSVSP